MKTFHACFHLFRFSSSQAVDSNGKEDIEEDVVAKDEQDQEVQAHGQAETRGALIWYFWNLSSEKSFHHPQLFVCF